MQLVTHKVRVRQGFCSPRSSPNAALSSRFSFSLSLSYAVVVWTREKLPIRGEEKERETARKFSSE